MKSVVVVVTVSVVVTGGSVVVVVVVLVVVLVAVTVTVVFVGAHLQALTLIFVIFAGLIFRNNWRLTQRFRSSIRHCDQSFQAAR
jgi:hypothetical protein